MLLCLALLLWDCSSDDPGPSEELISQDSTILVYLENLENDSAIADENGIYAYPITENPTGANAAGNILSIYYKVKVVDTDLTIAIHDAADGDPIKLKQGVNAVYPVGLDLSLAQMNEGETYGFIIPSTLAYDTLGFSTLIPANAIVEITVELIAVESEEDILTSETTAINQYIDDVFLDSLELVPLDSLERIGQGGEIIYKRLAAGLSGFSPSNGQLIGINYEGRFVGTDSVVFDNRYVNTPFEFALNTLTVIPGLDLGIAAMEFGERALIIIPSQSAYRESARVIPHNIPTFTDLTIEVGIVPDYVARVQPYQALIFEVTLINPN